MTLRHPATLSHLVIAEAIEDAGFDVADDTIAGPARPSGTSASPTHSRRDKKHLEQCRFCRNRFGSGHDGQAQPTSSGHSRNVPHRLTLSVGGMNCGVCTTAVTQALSGLPGVHDISVSLLGNSASAILNDKIIVPDVLEAFKTIGYEADVASIQPLNMDATAIEMDGPLHVSLSVGGMTCAACSSTVARLLTEQEGVSDVSVNLIGNSASLIVGSRELLPIVQDIIESAGFEASVANTELVGPAPNTEEVARGQRTVDLRIEGMRCE